MKLLSIGVPTYNRASKLQAQLNFLFKEFNMLTEEEKSQISFYVSDNCSTDNTKEVVTKSELFEGKCVECTYLCNATNLGLAGNLKRLYSELNGEYIWVIGDDDYLKPGIVRQVVEKCKEYSYDYIFVNHTIIKNNSIVKESVLEGIDKSRTDKSVLWELYKQSGTVMMLISACIYRTMHVKQYISKYETDLVVPCSLSFYCAAQGKTKLIEGPCIVNNQTENSWKKMIVKVFFELIPSLLLELPNWGYNRRECFIEYLKLKRHYLRPKVKEILHIVK